MTAISRQTMPPAAVADEPEWIELSAEQSIVSDQTATQKAVPHFVTPTPNPTRSARWPKVVAALLVVGAAGWWFSQSPRAPVVPLPVPVAVAVVDAGAPVVAVVVPVVVPAGDAAVPEPADENEWAAHPDDVVVDAGGARVRVDAPSRSGTAGLKLSARLAPNQKPGAAMVAVFFESEPPGVVIKVDKKELGRTPVTLHFKNGLTFDLVFEAKGKPPLKQWLMLTAREGKPPKVTLRNPVP